MRRRGLVALAVVLVVAVGVFSWRSGASLRAPSPRARAIALVEGQRPFALRLSGQTRWSACRQAATAGSIDVRCTNYLPDPARIDDALSLARDVRGTTDARWVLAVVDLLSGRGGAHTSASRIERLEHLTATDSGNAHLRNDLAVTYLARGDAWSLFLGLDQIERAYAIDSMLPAIAFNRALVLSEAHLSAEARLAWTRYIRNIGEREWAGEASERLTASEARLRPQIFDGRTSTIAAETQRDPQHAREHVLDSLLPLWAGALTSGAVARADSACGTIAAIGARVAAKSGDQSVVGIAQACQMPQRAVAEGVRRFADGSDRFRRGDFASAHTILGTAATRLRTLGAAPVAGWAEVMRGFVDIYAGRYPVADSAFAAIEREADARGDSALKARALWGRALSAARNGARALTHYERAAELYQQLDEPLNRAAMISQASDILLLLGRDEVGMRGKYEALSLLDRRLDARPRPGPLVALGMALVDLGLPAAGVAVLREAVGSTSASKRPNDRPEALIQLANAEIAVGREQIGRAHLLEALAAFATISDSSMLQRQQMAAALTLATLDAARAPDSAIARLTEVEAYYTRTKLQFNRGLPLARRGQLRLRRGDPGGGRKDIEEAVLAIERQAVSPDDPIATRNRAAAQREVYEALVGLDVDRGDAAGAFLVAERARGSLLDRVPRSAPDGVMLSYFALPDRLLVWIVSGDSLRLVVQPVRAAELRERVRLLESLIRNGDDTPAWRAASRSMFDLLIAPAIAEVGRASAITIVADGPLGRLPFIALRDSAGRYLGERVELTHASATRAVSGVTPSRTVAVVVGHPHLDTKAFPDLGVLRGAEREVDAVRRLYPGAAVIVDTAATKDAVVRAMSRASLFHFAGHARLVERTPSLSHLVLATSSSGGPASNALSAEEIARMDLRHMNLAILSSCGTTQARSRRDAGQGGLSEAFFAAGARAVISSRWTVDDAGTADLMERLHAGLARGERPAAALGRAQIALIGSRMIDRPLRVWAAFMYEER